ncbi:hypothetical protein BC937DRAFT_92141 [Endogone sp. FLAS-F59071]|nr:hypothetical protein BC937DRAFT_92141 [Endogone sp. FLAS-F59071]|eukprot:RUS21596.1 hypothetical protein BC937DRAFT_92141 [Endogone sp. FLAS-F59071]
MFKSTTFRLNFGPDYDPHKYRLIELPKGLDALLEDPNNVGLCIKGLPDDDAVLCTSESTFAIREVQLSNSLLLISPMLTEEEDDPAVPEIWSVQDNLSSIVELTPCLPRLERLNDLLGTSMYAGPEAESQHSQTELYTLEDLQTLVQASDTELRMGLRDRNAILIGGMQLNQSIVLLIYLHLHLTFLLPITSYLPDYYRLIQPAYLHTVLDTLITSATAEDMPFDALRLGDCAQSLQEHGISREIVRHCLRSFSETRDKGKVDERVDEEGDDDEVYTLSETKVCRFLGLRLLNAERGKSWNLQEFMILWESVVPDQFRVSLDILKGYHLLAPLPTDPTNLHARLITYFSHTDLPLDPARRFAELFAVRRRWTADEIEPYVADLVFDKKRLDAVLLKHTRSTKEKEMDGQMVTVYTARTK